MMNWEDDRWIKCPSCKKENCYFPRNSKYFKCRDCGHKFKDKDYKSKKRRIDYAENKR